MIQFDMEAYVRELASDFGLAHQEAAEIVHRVLDEEGHLRLPVGEAFRQDLLRRVIRLNLRLPQGGTIDVRTSWSEYFARRPLMRPWLRPHAARQGSDDEERQRERDAFEEQCRADFEKAVSEEETGLANSYLAPLPPLRLVQRMCQHFQGWPRVGECWLYDRGTTPSGYGLLPWTIGGLRTGIVRSTATHRVAMSVAAGRLRVLAPEDTVDHGCKTRLCGNPGHLEVVTRVENGRRARRTFASSVCEIHKISVKLRSGYKNVYYCPVCERDRNRLAQRRSLARRRAGGWKQSPPPPGQRGFW